MSYFCTVKCSVMYWLLCFLVLALGAGCSGAPNVMDAQTGVRRLNCEISRHVDSLLAERDSVYRALRVQKRRDSLYRCALAQLTARPNIYPSLLRYWADSIIDAESLLSDCLIDYDRDVLGPTEYYKEVIFPANEWHKPRSYDLDTLELVTGWLTFMFDKYNHDYFFLLDGNKQIVDVEDFFVGSRGHILAQRFADFDGDGRKELFVKFYHFEQNFSCVYDYLFTVENNRLKMKFALIVSSDDDLFHIKQRSQYKYIGRNRYAITTQLEKSQFNDQNTSKIVYRADSSYVLFSDELVRRYEQNTDLWW